MGAAVKGTKRYTAWTRTPKIPGPKQVIPLYWRNNLPDLSAADGSLLPFGYGRSYGDSCLNADNILLDATGLNQFMAFDEERGILRSEAGVSLAEILRLIVPKGWFLPVTPGTKYVSIGGAIANDVHGKDHHSHGTFGCHVTQFELLRSDGEQLLCSPTENTDLYKATIGGLGLTGVILWAEIALKPIPTGFMDSESIRFGNMEEFFEITEDSHANFEYTVSWVDMLQEGEGLGRGRYTRGNFYDPPLGMSKEPSSVPPLPMPVDFPGFTINPLTVKAFNTLYYNVHVPKVRRHVVHYDPFFYPLDTIVDWYKLYGEPGFYQYQFVLPFAENDGHLKPLKTIFRRIARSGAGTPLVVFKTFGDMPSPGMLSFPRPGVTLALDFANRGKKTLRLMDDLDKIVFEHGGALYPAKDGRMSPESFRRSYPNWQDFAQYVDSKFSSSFWRRVMEC